MLSLQPDLRKRNLHILGDRSLATVREGNEMAEPGTAHVKIRFVCWSLLIMACVDREFVLMSGMGGPLHPAMRDSGSPEFDRAACWLEVFPAS